MPDVHITIVPIDGNSVHFPTVKHLGRQNSATLGFFPEGAFVQYAAQRTILVALDADNTCLGYLLYRVSKKGISIVHLCISSVARGKGIAKQLVNHLKRITTSYYGIWLSCRRDYAENGLWKQLGFVYQADVPGRSKQGKPLDIWLYRHDHPQLWQLDDTYLSSPRICAVIDANIFFDLQDPTRHGAVESQALSADWLTSMVELCITDELINDVSKHDEEQKRLDNRTALSYYKHLSPASSKAEQLFDELCTILPTAKSPNAKADIRHIAQTIAANVTFFVTRDHTILDDYSEPLFAKYGLEVVRPSDLILYIDELQDRERYQPGRLAGSGMKVVLAQHRQSSILADGFLHSGERKALFEARLHTYLSDPKRYHTNVVLTADDIPQAIVAYDNADPKEGKIVLLIPFSYRDSALTASTK